MGLGVFRVLLVSLLSERVYMTKKFQLPETIEEQEQLLEQLKKESAGRRLDKILKENPHLTERFYKAGVVSAAIKEYYTKKKSEEK
jgi:hypothetical protein